MNHDIKTEIGFAAQVDARAALVAGIRFSNVYRYVARGPVKGLDGRWRRKCKWVEEVKNLVTTEGLNDVLTKYFKGSTYTATPFMGLVNNAGFTAFAVGDTAAQIGGSNQWAEATAYSESVRQTVTLGTAAAGSISNSAAKCVFSINGTVTIHGAFIATVSTKGGTTGVLYGEAALSADRALSSGDTLTLQVTLTAS